MTSGLVLFRCDAGIEDGLGHLMRCLALAEAVKKIHNNEILFITHDPDGTNQKRIKDRGFNHKKAKERAGSIKELNLLFGYLDKINTEINWIILDSKKISDEYVIACKQKAYVLCFDDEQFREMPCDILVNNHIGVKLNDYKKSKKRQLLLGPKYNTIREIFFEKEKIKSNQNANILITLGGEDPGDHTSWLLKNLHSLFKNIPVVVVIGPAHPQPWHVRETAKQWVPHAKLITDIEDLAVYISKARLVLTAGGTTCYEIAAAQVAQGVIVVEDHQQALVDPMVKAGAVALLGKYDNLIPSNVIKQVERLLYDKDIKNKLINNAFELFQMSGTVNIARAMDNKLLG